MGGRPTNVMINISYDILFSVTLQHEFFASGQSNDLQLLPSADCRQLFDQLNVQWRVIGNRLVALVRVNGSDQPFVVAPAGSYQTLYGRRVFRVYLQGKGGKLFNYTNLPADVTRNIFYLSNLANNPIGGSLY